MPMSACIPFPSPTGDIHSNFKFTTAACLQLEAMTPSTSWLLYLMSINCQYIEKALCQAWA